MIRALRKINLFSRTGLTAMLMLLCILCAGLPQDAQAATAKGLNGSVCTDGNGVGVQGFSVAVIFCIREVIEDALFGTDNSSLFPNANADGQGGYMQRIVNYLMPFKWAAITLAFTLYGMKLMTLGVEQLTKESSILLFKTGMVLFMIDNLDPQTASVFTGGWYAALTGAMDEFVTLVSGVLGNPPSWCTTFPMPQPGALTVGGAPPAMPNPSPYLVWQYFDCIFQGVMNVGTSPAGVSTAAVSIVIILGAALWMGGPGLFLIIMAVTLFIAALFSLIRAIYAVLISYFILALLLILGPLIIPLMIFDSKYTFEVFWRWLGLITSTLFTPMFVVGFLCFVILTEVEMVSGEAPGTTAPACSVTAPGSTPQTATGNCSAAFNGCHIGPRYPGDTNVAAGNCSINQLLASCTQNISGTDPMACLNYNNYATNYPASLQPNDVIEPWMDPTLRKCCVVSQLLFRFYLNVHFPYLHQNWCAIRNTGGCGWTDPLGCVKHVVQDVAQIGCDTGAAVATGVADVVAWSANQLIDLVNNLLSKIKILVPMLQFPIKQMIIIVVAIFITTIVFRDLLDIIPHMAKEMSISVGLGVLSMAQVPLERMVASAVKGGGDALGNAMKGARGLSGLKGAGSALAAGARGAATGAFDTIR